MCLAVPMQIQELLDGGLARVSAMGAERNIALDLTPEAKAGDYVLVHAGFAIEVVDEKYAQDTLELIREFPELVADQFDEAREAEAGAASTRQTEEVG